MQGKPCSCSGNIKVLGSVLIGPRCFDHSPLIGRAEITTYCTSYRYNRLVHTPTTMQEETTTPLDRLLEQMTFPPSYSKQVEGLRRQLPKSYRPVQHQGSDARKRAIKARRLAARKRTTLVPDVQEILQEMRLPELVTPCPSPTRLQLVSAPHYRTLRLWKMKPGRRYFLEEIIGRDVVLKHNGNLTLTPLPASCPLPPNIGNRFYLVAEKGQAGDLHRIRVKWVPVSAGQR